MAGIGRLARPAALCLLLAGTVPALSGCGIFEREVPPPCPEVLVLRDAGELVRYREGPGRDLTDVLFEAEILDFAGQCEYNDERTRVELAFGIAFEVRRGPALTGREVTFEYFIAVPEFYPAPEGKRRFEVTVTFEGNRSRTRTGDRIAIEMPIDRSKTLEDYTVYIGFQLRPGEIEANRRRLGL